MKNKLLIFSGLGAVIVALCCFTPILAITLAAIGLASMTEYLDFILLPLLAVFIGLFIFALCKKCCGKCKPS